MSDTKLQGRLVAGDPCPIEGCGERLEIAAPSGAYIECKNRHLHAVRVRCQEPGCRRIATSFVSRSGKVRRATCADHDSWPY
jgi:hypothetical protein